jgi:hypothetical protein
MTIVGCRSANRNRATHKDAHHKVFRPTHSSRSRSSIERITTVTGYKDGIATRRVVPLEPGVSALSLINVMQLRGNHSSRTKSICVSSPELVHQHQQLTPTLK